MRTWDNISLLERERQAIKKAVKMLKSQFPVSSVILFGSKVRGEDDEHSDIDFLLVTSRALDWKEEKAVVEVLFDIGMEYDVISAHCLLHRMNGMAGYSCNFQSTKKSAEMEPLSHEPTEHH